MNSDDEDATDRKRRPREIIFPPMLWARIKSQAEQQGISASEYVRRGSQLKLKLEATPVGPATNTVLLGALVS